jgi:hypothetical protein
MILLVMGIAKVYPGWSFMIITGVFLLANALQYGRSKQAQRNSSWFRYGGALFVSVALWWYSPVLLAIGWMGLVLFKM